MKPIRRIILTGIMYFEASLGIVFAGSEALANNDVSRSSSAHTQIAAQFAQWRDSQRANQGVFGLTVETSRPTAAIARLVTTPLRARSTPLNLVARVHWRYLHINEHPDGMQRTRQKGN